MLQHAFAVRYQRHDSNLLATYSSAASNKSQLNPNLCYLTSSNFGLAVGGREGLRTVVSQILAEADLTMAVDCYTDLSQLAVERLD